MPRSRKITSKRKETKKASVKTIGRSATTGRFTNTRYSDKIVKDKKESHQNMLQDPEVSYTSKIRAIGNSKGVILNNQLMEAAGLEPDADVVVQAKDGVIYIMEAKASDVNTDLATWDKQFKAAIKKGAKPENDLFEGLNNEFDNNEW